LHPAFEDAESGSFSVDEAEPGQPSSCFAGEDALILA